MSNNRLLLVFALLIGSACAQIINPGGGSVTNPLAWQSVTVGGTATTAVAQNATRIWSNMLPYTVTTTAICYNVATADNTTNVYDIGLYDSTGTLKVHVGATAGTTLFATTGIRCANWAASATLTPGLYALALTSSAATPAAVLAGAATSGIAVPWQTVAAATGGTTTGGALNSSITFPATSWATGQAINFNIH